MHYLIDRQYVPRYHAVSKKSMAERWVLVAFHKIFLQQPEAPVVIFRTLRSIIRNSNLPFFWQEGPTTGDLPVYINLRLCPETRALNLFLHPLKAPPIGYSATILITLLHPYHQTVRHQQWQRRIKRLPRR